MKRHFLNFYLLLPFLFFAQKNQLNELGVPFLNENKWGVMNIETKKYFIKPEFQKIDDIDDLNYNVFRFYDGDLQGALFFGKIGDNEKSGILLPAEFEDIKYSGPFNKSGAYIVTKNGKQGLFDIQGNEVLTPSYALISSIPKLNLKEDPSHHEWEYLYIVSKSKNDYSSGVYDIEHQNFVIPPEFNIEYLGRSIRDSLSMIWTKDIYDLVLMDQGNQRFLITDNFNLIELNKFIKTAPKESSYEIVNDTKPEIAIGNPKFPPNYCELSTNKLMKTKKKNKYNLTDQCYLNYQIIKSPNGRIGLINKEKPSFKNPTLEPIYQRIEILSLNPYIFLVEELKNGILQQGIFRPQQNFSGESYPEFFLKPKYAKITLTDNFIQLKDLNGEHDYLFLYIPKVIYHQMNAKKISKVREKECNECNPAIYKITDREGNNFYMDGNGYLYLKR